MIERVVGLAERTGVSGIVAVMSADGLKPAREKLNARADYVVQRERLGTGHALTCAKRKLAGHQGAVLVLNGDGVLYTAGTLKRLISKHRRCGAAATVLTADYPDPAGYGRIVRDEKGGVLAIVEERDATPEQRRIREVNSSVYCFEWRKVSRALNHIGRDNDQGEFYLTDVISYFRARRERVETYKTGNWRETLGVNSRRELAFVQDIVWEMKRDKLMASGVTLVEPQTVYVDDVAVIGRDTTVFPGTFISGKSRVGSGCRIGPYTVIEDCVIADDAAVIMSHCERARINRGAAVGPFAHLRPGARIGAGDRIGNFVEVKNSRIGPNTNAAHLTYLGDAVVGSGVNIGAGTITANYDGKRKHRTVIDNGASTGCNTVLVAPVRVGREAKTGAGTVVPKGQNVPRGQTVVGAPARRLGKRKKGARNA